MGIVLYCLVVGRQPWDGANAEELIHGILEEGLEVPEGITDGNAPINFPGGRYSSLISSPL